ncbi:MAG: glycosyltransferase [Pyrinomonadaceae bacterium]
MKLVVVSHTPHYRHGGRVVGWGPTIREIDQLSEIFDQVVHIAPVHSKDAPQSALAYESERVRVRAVAPSGGGGVKNKLDVLRRTQSYVRAMRQELRDADAVHVRCPANISLVALLVLMFTRHPRKRWLKYAGNWNPKGAEAWSYTLQRWLLRSGWHKGVVTVNGEWPNQPSFVRSFFNPCLNDQELLEGREISGTKQMTDPIRLIFVGRLDSGKGADRTLQIVARHKKLGGAALLDLVGDGKGRQSLEQLAKALGISDQVTFHGSQPRPTLGPLYSRAHLMILASGSEGWPKVLSEAMAYGVVPIASNVSSIPQYLERFNTGRSFAPGDLDAFADSIQWYATHPGNWKQESKNAVKEAELFSYARHCKAVRRILEISDLDPVRPSARSEAFQS